MGHAGVLGGAAGAVRRGVRHQSRGPAGQADPRLDERHLLGRGDSGLLSAGHPAAHRQADRQALSGVRRAAARDGRRSHRRDPVLRREVRHSGAAAGESPSGRHAGLALYVHHRSLRGDFRLPRHPVPHGGKVHHQRKAGPENLLRRDDQRICDRPGLGRGGGLLLRNHPAAERSPQGRRIQCGV